MDQRYYEEVLSEQYQVEMRKIAYLGEMFESISKGVDDMGGISSTKKSVKSLPSIYLELNNTANFRRHTK